MADMLTPLEWDTALGSHRVVDVLMGELLPRIC